MAKVTVEPERRARKTVEGKTRMVVVKREIAADVCGRHQALVERESIRTQQRKTRDRLRNSKKRLTDTQAAQLRELERGLAE